MHSRLTSPRLGGRNRRLSGAACGLARGCHPWCWKRGQRRGARIESRSYRWTKGQMKRHSRPQAPPLGHQNQPPHDQSASGQSPSIQRHRPRQISDNCSIALFAFNKNTTLRAKWPASACSPLLDPLLAQQRAAPPPSLRAPVLRSFLSPALSAGSEMLFVSRQPELFSRQSRSCVET
jgi:hypothetical protein